MEKGQKQDVSTARCVTVASVIHTYLFFYRVVSRNIYSNVHKFTHNSSNVSKTDTTPTWRFFAPQFSKVGKQQPVKFDRLWLKTTKDRFFSH